MGTIVDTSKFQMAASGEKFDRLYEEQLKAIEETKEKVSKFTKFKDDYVALQSRLESLPDCVSYDVMVPFGKLAFMPGKLVHTNEILCLLGDNWFADRSAKQACGIIDRRIQQIDKTIEDLNKQYGLLEPRAELTQEIQEIAAEQHGVVEIKEEYDADKEEVWKQQHKIRVRQSRQKNIENSQINKHQSMTDEEVFARLDELEIQESQRRELSKMNNESEKQSEHKVHWGQIPSTLNEEPYIASSDEDYTDDSSYSEESDSDDKDVWTYRPTNIIHFKHSSKTGSTSEISQVGSGTDSQTDENNITSPADIYQQYCSQLQYPKSILKKSADSDNIVKSTNLQCQYVDSPVAFTETVVEHKHETTVNDETSDIQPVKHVSKFKAQRMQQKR